MKKQLQLNKQVKELSKDELLNTYGGFTIIDTVKCITGTLTSGAGFVKTILLGPTIWGMARIIGVTVGCSK